jgi:hypothetical protein
MQNSKITTTVSELTAKAHHILVPISNGYGTIKSAILPHVDDPAENISITLKNGALFIRATEPEAVIYETSQQAGLLYNLVELAVKKGKANKQAATPMP